MEVGPIRAQDNSTVPGCDTVSWQAVLGPRALPGDIAARWNSELERILQMPEFKTRLAGEGTVMVGGPASRFLDVLQRDVARRHKVVKAAGIKPGA
jgi:tripartite-type tricarboxylate transporter receptor subunit TctC